MIRGESKGDSLPRAGIWRGALTQVRMCLQDQAPEDPGVQFLYLEYVGEWEEKSL